MTDEPASEPTARATRDAPPGPAGGAHAVLPPALAGHFELLQSLGSGSSGTVFRARLTTDYGDLPAGSEVAIKFLRRELVADERARARLSAEGELGQRVRHANVAAIFGVETIDLLGLPVTYLVMQYVLGTTLRAFVGASGAPVEDLTRRIGADAAAGLFALHRQGVVHRDVKPENLILTPEGGLKIVDLGLARPIGARGGGGSSGSGRAPGHSSGGGIGGSVAYAAPETLRGEPAGPRSDLYSLGVVLFEVSTGRHPFAECTAVDDMLDAHLRRPPPRPSHLRPRLSPFLEQVLLDLLQKDPDRRPRDAAELQRTLQQGERSEYWRRHEARAPALASSRRLLRMRRPAEAPFAGRTAELAQLDAAFDRARRGRGSAITAVGPEGSGRRRLFDEAMQRWLERGSALVYLGGEADPDLGHAEPFAGSLLDWLLRGDDRGSPHAQARAAAAARTLLQLGEADADALAAVAFGHSTEAPEVRADRLATAVLRIAASAQPLVLRVDHADRLDTSGRLVLARLAARAPREPLLLLLAAGPDGVPQAAGERLELGGLDETEFRAFGRALFRGGAVADAVLLAAHRTLSGVPGALLEALDHQAQLGALHGRPGDYHGLDPAVELRPAPDHVARFQLRVAGLSVPQRAVLTAAAVLGERCALPDLADLTGATELAVLETLSVFRGRIVRAQGGEVSFRHRDFRQALLRQVPDAELQRLHLRAAELLEQRGRSRLEIGMHRSQARDHQGCLEPLLDALDERVRAGSRRTALRLAGRLAVHLAQVPADAANERRRLRHLLLAGGARRNAGQGEAAARALRDAEALARTLGDLESSAAARTGLAAHELDGGRLLSGIALLESVHDDLAAVHGERADAFAAQAHGLHGRILLYRGQSTEGLRHLQAALRRLPETEHDLRCHLLIDLARMEALRYHFPTALKTLQKVERERAAAHLPRVRLRLSIYRGQVRAAAGGEEATRDLRAAIEEADRLSLPAYHARAVLLLGEWLFRRRRDDEARTAFADARAQATAGGDRLGEAMARAWLVRLHGADPDLAALVDELGLPSVRLNWLLAVAGAALDAGDEGAAAAVDAAVRDLLDAADLPLSLHLRALALLDRPASARSLVRAIAERFPDRSSRRRFLAEWTDGARI